MHRKILRRLTTDGCYSDGRSGKNFRDKTAVSKLNLSIGDGELFGLLGVNGAGKTTIIRMLSCLSHPTGGDALVLGNSILNNPMEIKKLINLSPQETAVAPNLTVKENLELIAGIYGFSPSKVKEKTEQVIHDFSLSEVEKQKAKTLSGGWQRRLSIAMALITEPKILFLDESTLCLDVLAKRELWAAIKKLKGSIIIILTTHYLEEAEALCDRIAIMVKGELKALGTVPELIQETGAGNFEDAFISIAERETIL